MGIKGAKQQSQSKRSVTDTSMTAVGGTYSRMKRWFIDQVQDTGVKQNLNATILIGLAGLIGLVAGLVGWFVGAVDNNWQVRQELQMEHYKQRQEIFTKVANDLPRTSAALRQHAEHTIWLNAVYDPDVSLRVEAKDSFARSYREVVQARDELAHSLRANDNFVTSCQLIELRFADEVTARSDTDSAVENNVVTNAELARRCARIVRRRLDLMTELTGRRADKRVAHVDGLRADVKALRAIIDERPASTTALSKEQSSASGASQPPAARGTPSSDVLESPVAAWLGEVDGYLKERSTVTLPDGSEELSSVASTMNADLGPLHRASWKNAIAEESDLLLAANYRAADAAFYLLVEAMSDNLSEQRRELDAESRTGGIVGVAWFTSGSWYIRIAKAVLALIVAGVTFFAGCLTIAWLIDTADDYKVERSKERSRMRLAEAKALLAEYHAKRRDKQRSDQKSPGASANGATFVTESKDSESFVKELQI